jgi:Ribonuclease G/E
MVATDLTRKLARVLAQTRSREVFVSLHPTVASHVLTPSHNMIRPLEKRFRKYIRIIEDPNQHMEEVRIDEKK